MFPARCRSMDRDDTPPVGALSLLDPSHMRRSIFAVVLYGVSTGASAHAQIPISTPSPSDSVRAIAPPRTPLPSEAASAGVTRFSFIAYGDTRGLLDGQELQYDHRIVVQTMLRTVAALANGPDPVRFVVWSGDAVADGRVAQQWDASFVDVVSRLTRDGGLSFFPAPGNHDVAHTSSLSAPGRLAGLPNYYAAFRNLIPPEGSPRRLNGYPTFAVGYGNTFVILWDSNIADDSTQYNWIKNQLEKLDKRRFVNIVAAAHHPAYSSGPHGGPIVEPQSAAIRQQYMPLFRKHHVRLLLAGHEHLFEHWVERYEDAGKPYRLDYIVSGGGGAPLYSYQGEPALRDYVQAGASEKLRVEHLAKPGLTAGENPHHFVVVHVDGDRIRVDVVGTDFGQAFAPYRSRTVDLIPPTPAPPAR
jgi:3',5'-cyclic AMP phosphodiesterase CpdA